MKVIILSGVQGSGKSTLSASFKGTVVSADHYLTNDNFNFAHRCCFSTFLAALDSQVPLIIVDNTNTTAKEIAPYYLAAEAMSYEVEVVRVHCDLEVAWNRRKGTVPFEKFIEAAANFKARDVAPWWKVRD